ncbi:hypothetical protein Z517_07325 [Fonsecaea pedrosoi CBS 271.37]|uniref:Xylanolytic transcriptional activator regulatory domain-containing protein n=1 Tax=Fonsecaea pedrosoi CBS 271.37 TaxID=1442368 RepID=A0A0D2H7R7_9EURO|nr:uncharacterized protein Z517_07325 [Fonsecaea pedrosoi CBS 271.37]KIW80709.1 hypothetical protein Z517_07325 [Fonsecaea pedrosoi CBS 271.37]
MNDQVSQPIVRRVPAAPSPPPRKRARLHHSTSPPARSTRRVSQNELLPSPRRAVETSVDFTEGRNPSAISPQFLPNRLNQRKRWLYVGACSTWSFNIRVATMIRSSLKDGGEVEDDPFSLDGNAYDLSLKRVNSDMTLDLSRLPSLDYAIYLVNTVNFHLGGILRLFDEYEFLQNLHEFYNQGSQKARAHKLWYIQCLLLLALGKGFLNVRNSPDNTSSTDYFVRAMSILPDTTELYEEPVLAVEVLATVALYFYCLDMKQSAYSYIGQALRIALVEGLHAELPPLQLGDRFTERCRNAWWTTYILDRTLSAAVGAPISAQDSHIQQSLPSPQQVSQRDATLVMHVKLCRMVSSILTELYTANGSLENTYLSKVRSVLKQMADIAKQLEEVIDFKFKSSLETLSKGALYLRMLYNQCIVLATRPLLLCLLQETLQSLRPGSNGVKVYIPPSIRDLLKTCSDSATKTLKMLSALSSHSFLDTFLPFDLEFACSASSVVTMVDEILRGASISSSTKDLRHKILDEIAAGGNKAAPYRQRELRRLSELADRLWNTIDALNAQNRSPGTAASDHEVDQVHQQRHNPGVQSEDHQLGLDSRAGDDGTAMAELPGNGLEQPLVLLEEQAIAIPPGASVSSSDFAQTFDFSPEQMLLLADHLDVNALQTGFDFASHGFNEWI